MPGLPIRGGYALDERATAALLGRLLTRLEPLDLVFLDPPYEASTEYTATLALLGSPRGRALLAPGARVIAEHSRKSELPERFGNLRRTRLLPHGDAALSF